MAQDNSNYQTSITSEMRQQFAPVIITFILVAWTAVVYPFSKYGDWEIYPALVAFPVAFIWHFVIIYRLRGNRKTASIAAFAHLGIMLIVWFGCLMMISKDSI